MADLVDGHLPARPLVLGAPGVQMVERRMIEIVDHQLDRHTGPGRHPAENPGEARQGQEAQGALHVHPPCLPGRDETNVRPQHPAQNQPECGEHPECDALEQVERDDTNERDDVHGQLAVTPHVPQMGDVDQPDPDHDKQASQRGQWNPLDRSAEEQGEQRHPHAVQDG